MDPLMLGRALERTREVVAATRPDQLNDSTPNGDWSVHQLLNHLIGGCLAFAAGAKGDTEETTPDIDRVEGDHLAAYDRASQAALEAAKQDGALDKKFTMPWGETPGNVALMLTLTETTVHGWDLAQAIDYDMGIDEDIAEAIYSSTSRMMEPKGDFPRGDSFAAPVDVPDDAPVRDRMLGYLGRQP